MQEKNQQELVPGSVCILDTAYPTNVTRRYLERKKWVRPNSNIVLSFIPGTILQLLVKEGQAVKAGDKLAVFVAMKMHNTVLAPHDGEVVKIFVCEGDRFPKGASLFEVRP
ncbi:MAG: biotin/lipoyl-binding protein [Prevotellaceae bacterium]|jgi:biotin carboxyl carrier protein|nr:biotin/lipoyl-binding protein [Prevotellaceae bacterium]